MLSFFLISIEAVLELAGVDVDDTDMRSCGLAAEQINSVSWSRDVGVSFITLVVLLPSDETYKKKIEIKKIDRRLIFLNNRLLTFSFAACWEDLRYQRIVAAGLDPLAVHSTR